jgi:hypothetical protein
LLFGIFVPFGTLLLFIPSIIIFGFYIFIFFTYRDKSIEKPLREARTLSRGNFWKIVGIFILISIMISIINFGYQFLVSYAWNFDSATYTSWFNPNTRNFLMIILDDIIYYQMINIIFSPLFICILTPLYTSIRAKRELGYTHQKGYRAMQQRYAQMTRSSSINQQFSQGDSNQDEQGFYCPFCGFYMPTKLKYCGNCGEALNFES